MRAGAMFVKHLAFLSAFRSVEALLGCGARSLEKREIAMKLKASRPDAVTGRTRTWSDGAMSLTIRSQRPLVQSMALRASTRKQWRP